MTFKNYAATKFPDFYAAAMREEGMGRLQRTVALIDVVIFRKPSRAFFSLTLDCSNLTIRLHIYRLDHPGVCYVAGANYASPMTLFRFMTFTTARAQPAA